MKPKPKAKDKKATESPMQRHWNEMNRKQRREMMRKMQSEDLNLEVVHPDAAGIDIGNVVLMAVGFAAWFHFQSSNRTASAFEIVPFTSLPGQKFDPAFSPDGNCIAFAWRGEKDDNQDIYVKLIGAGTPLRLTTNPDSDSSPAWSPDGRFIAFFRQSKSGGAYYLVPSLGGPERKLADAYYYEYEPVLGLHLLHWSPDGKFLAVIDQPSPKDLRPSIVLISVESGQKKVVASPPGPYLASPTFSPDGKSVAFVEGLSTWAQDAYVESAAGREARRLTFDKRIITGLTWTGDGKEIVFSSNRGGLSSLWRVSVSGGTPEPVSGVGEDTFQPSISRQGNRLANAC